MADKELRNCDHGAKTVPQLGEYCHGALLDAGFSPSLLDDLLASISEAGLLVDRIPDSIRVSFPATRAVPEQVTHEFVIAHWKEISGRLLLSRLCADRALRDLLVGFVDALQTCNAAVACLCARASIENAAAYDSLSRFFVVRSEKIEAMILPYLKGASAPADLTSLCDHPLVDELTRFRHGARLWPIGSSPKTVAEWEKWRKHSRYETRQVAEKRKDEQSAAGQMLDALSANQRNVLTSIEKLAKSAEYMETLALYDMLSEFCHPNADNRGLGIKAVRVEESTAVVDFVGTLSWIPQVIRGAELSTIGVNKAIHIHIAAHNAIHDSAHELQECA